MTCWKDGPRPKPAVPDMSWGDRICELGMEGLRLSNEAHAKWAAEHTAAYKARLEAESKSQAQNNVPPPPQKPL